MKPSGAWIGAALLLGVATTLATPDHPQQAAQHKVKRQIYYPPRDYDESYEVARKPVSRGTGHLPIAPQYPSNPHPHFSRPKPIRNNPPPRSSYKPAPTRKARPAYKPPQPVYQEPHRPHDDSYEEENSIPGTPGVDYPIYNEIPYTKFECESVPYRPGMYANPEAGCQLYHVCHDDRFGPRGAEFLCTNGTLFNQETFSCDWWFNVDCSKATSFYDLNLDPEHNPYNQKPYDGPLNLPDESYEDQSYHQPDPPKPAYRPPTPFYRRN